jgi:hypothetical protein
VFRVTEVIWGNENALPLMNAHRIRDEAHKGNKGKAGVIGADNLHTG